MRNTNCLRSGDSFIMVPVTFADTMSAGDNRLWDLSGTKICGKSRKLTLNRSGETDDSLYCIVGNTAYHFLCHGDSVSLNAFENNLSDMAYSRKELLLAFPFDFNSQVSGAFCGTGRYADKWHHVMNGNYRSVADARGSLITIDGDTINNVTRISTVRNMNSLYLAADSSVADSMYLWQHDSRLYAPGYRYPLMMSSAVYAADGITRISHKAWYIPADAIEALDDPDNSDIRREEKDRRNVSTSPESDSGMDKDRNIAYSFRQDRGTESVTIEFSVARPADIELVLSDMGGIVYRRESTHAYPGETYSVTFDYGGLPFSAAYGVGITAGQEHYSEKFYR